MSVNKLLQDIETIMSKQTANQSEINESLQSMWNSIHSLTDSYELEAVLCGFIDLLVNEEMSVAIILNLKVNLLQVIRPGLLPAMRIPVGYIGQIIQDQNPGIHHLKFIRM